MGARAVWHEFWNQRIEKERKAHRAGFAKHLKARGIDPHGSSWASSSLLRDLPLPPEGKTGARKIIPRTSESVKEIDGRRAWGGGTVLTGERPVHGSWMGHGGTGRGLYRTSRSVPQLEVAPLWKEQEPYEPADHAPLPLSKKQQHLLRVQKGQHGGPTVGDPGDVVTTGTMARRSGTFEEEIERYYSRHSSMLAGPKDHGTLPSRVGSERSSRARSTVSVQPVQDAYGRIQPGPAASPEPRSAPASVAASFPPSVVASAVPSAVPSVVRSAARSSALRSAVTSSSLDERVAMLLPQLQVPDMVAEQLRTTVEPLKAQIREEVEKRQQAEGLLRSLRG